jgi:hypothetical protein
MSGIGKTGEVERVLVSGSRDDRVHLAGERELGRGLDRVPGDATGVDGALTIGIGVAGAQTPGADGNLSPGWEWRDLVFGSYQDGVGVEGFG